MFIVELLVWASLTFYTVCFFPQILKNYQEKSTRGLSNVMLLAYYVAYIPMLYYVFYCDLILPYKVVLPIEVAVMTLMIFQKFYYHGLWSDKLFLSQFVGINLLMGLLYPLSRINPYSFGMACGWVACVFFAIYPIPQVVKLYRTKSVEGFSFGFVTVQACAFLCEGIAAVLKNLPLPTLFMIAKGFIFYGIFCWQFWLYKKRT